VERDEFLAALVAALDAIDQFNVEFVAAHGRPPGLGDPMPELPLQSVDSADFGDALHGALGEEDDLEAA